MSRAQKITLAVAWASIALSAFNLFRISKGDALLRHICYAEGYSAAMDSCAADLNRAHDLWMMAQRDSNGRPFADWTGPIPVSRWGEPRFAPGAPRDRRDSALSALHRKYRAAMP